MPAPAPTADTPLEMFRRAYFGPIDHYLAWHDGHEADTACLAVLAPVERAQAENRAAHSPPQPTEPKTLVKS